MKNFDINNSVKEDKLFSQMSWKEISECVEKHSANVFELGAKKEIILKNGEKYMVQVVDRNDGLILGFVDLYECDEDFEQLTMLDYYGQADSYSCSNVNDYLNDKFYNLLPDDFADVLMAKEMRDEIKGEVASYIFIPSEMEVFGKQIYAINKDGNQFELYKDWRNRLAGTRSDEFGKWYWLRSMAETPSTNVSFCNVDGNGRADCDPACISNYVRPHFKIV
jgi:hypothetical protein